MKRLLLIIFLIFPLSCYDGLSDMLDDVTMKVPICVDATGGDDLNDGRGWRNAFQTLQAAVAAAEDGDEIWVAGTQNITATVVIDKVLSLYGGFSGRESRINQRNIEANNTTLSGTVAQLITVSASGTVLIDGFTVTGGVNPPDPNPNSISISINSKVQVKNCFFGDGRRIYVQGELYARDCKFNNRTSDFHLLIETGSFTAENCIFMDNSAPNSTVISAIDSSSVIVRDSHFENNSNGNTSGAVLRLVTGSAVFTNTWFINNRVNNSYGGAVYMSGGSAEFRDSLFKENITSGMSGGAIYALGGATVTIDNTEFYRNSATNTTSGCGGAVYVDGSGSTLTISRSKFGDKDTVDSGNIAGSQGGAIYAENVSNIIISDKTSFYRNQTTATTGTSGGGAIFVKNSNLEISESYFGGDLPEHGNKTGSSFSGGALNSDGSNLIISNSFFMNNQGGMYGGAIVLHGSVNTADITGTEFTGNKLVHGGQARGGAVYSSILELNIDQCIFSNNSIVNSNISSGGGAVTGYNSKLIINNTIFKNNNAPSGGAIQVTGLSEDYKPVNISSCIFAENTATKGGAVNLEGTVSTEPSRLVNSVFYGNIALETGGALQMSGHNHFLVNNTFYNNSADDEGGALYMVISLYSNMYNCVFWGNSAMDLSSSNIRCLGEFTINDSFYFGGVWADDVAANRCITTSPANPFVNTNPGSSNFLYPGSIIVNKGLHPVPGFTMPATDLAGNPRIAMCQHSCIFFLKKLSS